MAERTDGGGSGQTRIFISYRRGDTSGYAGRLADDLRDRFGTDRVFRDIDTIGTGEDFKEAIDQAVGSCDVFVAVIGTGWLASQDRSGGRRLDDPDDFVRLEIAAALQRNIMVVPVLVEGASMPARADLPDQLAGLVRRNAIEVSDSRWNYDVGRLLVTLESLRAAATPTPPGPSAPPTPAGATTDPVGAAPGGEPGAGPSAPRASIVATAAELPSGAADPSSAMSAGPTGAGPVDPRPPAPAPVSDRTTTKSVALWSAIVQRRKWALGVAVALFAVAVGTALLLPDSSGDSGNNTSTGPAGLSTPAGVAFGGGALYVADQEHYRIVRVTPSAISVVAGTGDSGYGGNGGAAATATIDQVGPIAVDAAGSVYLGELNHGGIRKVSADGTIDVVAVHSPGVTTITARAMAVEADGALLVATDREVLRVAPDGTLVSVAGSADTGFAGDGGPATEAKLDSPSGLAVDAAHNIYIADTGNNRVRKIGADGTIVTVAGTGKDSVSGDGGLAVEANLNAPRAVAVDFKGVVYVASSNRVRRIGVGGQIDLLAGNVDDSSDFAGDDGPAQASLLDGVVALAVDSDGNLYLSDAGNNRVRRISTDGIITTVA